MQDSPNARTLTLAMQEEVAVSFLGLVIFVPSFHQSPSNSSTFLTKTPRRDEHEKNMNNGMAKLKTASHHHPHRRPRSLWVPAARGHVAPYRHDDFRGRHPHHLVVLLACLLHGVRLSGIDLPHRHHTH